MVMKSIEERAKEFAQNFEIIPKNMDCEGCDTCTKCKDYRKYVDIVTEQKNIDIEKACKVYRNELQRLKTLLDESVGVPANLVSVDKSLSRIRLEMYEGN